MRFVLVLSFTSILAFGQDAFVVPIPPKANSIVGSYVSGTDSTKASNDGHPVLVQTSDQIFPHIATGSGWETVIVIVNMSAQPIDFVQRFYAQSGQPMTVTFRNYPQGELTTTAASQGRLPPGASFNFALFDSGQPLQVGWATLTYDSSQGRLGGYAIFRQRVPGRPDFEALVPLSAYDDYKFFMPFDNIQGFTTAIAIANPASNLSNRITFRFLALDGSTILTDVLDLPPNGQTAFVLSERFPAIAGRLGTLYVQSSVNRLSAMGLRFNTGGGNAQLPLIPRRRFAVHCF